MAADPQLPLEPVGDSPLFRASLSSLDHRTHAIKSSCKATLVKAMALRDLLHQVEQAEDALFSELSNLGRHIDGDRREWKSGGSWHASPFDVEGYRAWKLKRRRDETEQVDTLVISKLRALRSDIKMRGTGGGGALAKFEDTAKAHYHMISRYLQPHPGASSSELNNIDARREAQQAEFDLQRYTAHSHILWSAPPYSHAILEYGTCLNIWLNSSLPETDSAAYRHQSDGSPTRPSVKHRISTSAKRPVLSSSLSDTDTKPSSPAVPFPRARERRLGHKSSLPAIPSPSKLATESEMASSQRKPPSPAVLKHRISDAIEELAHRKTDLETAWAQRDSKMRSLEKLTEAKALVVSRIISPAAFLTGGQTAGRMSMDESRPATSPVFGGHEMTSGPNGEVVGFVKEKKSRGMGSRIKGMLSSTALASNLSSKAGGFKIPSSASSASLAQSSRMSLQLPPSNAQGNSSDKTRLHKSSSRHSIQAVPGEGYSSPFQRLFPGHSEDITSPISPADSTFGMNSPAMDRPHSAPIASMPLFRDIQMGTAQELSQQETQREVAGRKKEGLLWSPGIWDDVGGSSANRGGDRRDKSRWDKYWVVLASSRIYEYRDGLNGKPEPANEVIDLKMGATAREARDTDRRFAFEVVTPAAGKRSYQATSTQEMQSWIYAIGNAVESSLNGTSSVRTFDASKLRDAQGSDEHGAVGRNAGLGLGLPSTSMAFALSGKGTTFSIATGIGSGEAGSAEAPKHKSGLAGRKTSLKAAFRRSRNSFGQGIGLQKPHHHSSRHHSSGTLAPSEQVIISLDHDDFGASETALRLPRPSYLQGGSRHSSRSSEDMVAMEHQSLTSNGDEASISESRPTKPPTELIALRPGSSENGQRTPSWYGPDLDNDLKTTFLAMQPPSRQRSRNAHELTAVTRGEPDDVETHPTTSSEQADMAMLQRIADQPGNQSCADCCRRLNQENAQRWATISLHQRPTCSFLCIRCAGVHRSLGTHISKVRSLDLDKWPPEAIMNARVWGNSRSNAIWERLKAPGIRPPEESQASLKAYIEAKYVQGVWLSAEDKQYYLGESSGIAL